jgi:hypothetical protein
MGVWRVERAFPIGNHGHLAKITSWGHGRGSLGGLGGTREMERNWWWKEVRWKKGEGEERLKRDRANVHNPHFHEDYD